jgi:hypothetical protein
VGGIIRKICVGCLLVALLGILLFPRQVLLQCIAWKAASYCKQAFDTELKVEELVWENGEILFKGGRLDKKDELGVTFKTATLVPFLNWKERTFGGTLNFEELKIVHCKRESKHILSPPPPSFGFLTLKLDTTVAGAELFLYDYLARNHFFQKVNFDVQHHIDGCQTCGQIAFEWSPSTPPFIAYFQSPNKECLNLTVHLEQHSCPVLSHLITYFFQKYVPEPAFQWDIWEGTVDGDLEMVIYKGVPRLIKGQVDLREVHGENLPLEIQGAFEHLRCELDVDFSNIALMHGVFELTEGELFLEPKGQWWRGVCNLARISHTFSDSSHTLHDDLASQVSEAVLHEHCPRPLERQSQSAERRSVQKKCEKSGLAHVHSRVCIKEGKVETSLLQGSFMGMEGEIALDWKADDVLMRMSFCGSSKQISSHLPQHIRPRFENAFPEDIFTLDATVKKRQDGLELEGLLAMNDRQNAPHELHFGCALGEMARHFPAQNLTSLPNMASSFFSDSVDAFFDGLRGQFCFSQKIFGWFQGKGFPLEKFLTPFLFGEVRMRASGVVDFKGTFNNHYLILFYEGRDFCLESPHFCLEVDKVKKYLASEISAVHYLDLDNWNHLGFLPVVGGDYIQKKYGFHLEDIAALVRFENHAIHIQEICAQSNGLTFRGDVDVTVHSIENVDLDISVEYLKGALQNARQLLARFKPSLLWEIPIEGEIIGTNQPLYFHYHFSSKVRLVEGYIRGEAAVRPSLTFLGKDPLQATFSYDCITQKLACNVIQNCQPFLTLQAKTSKLERGYQTVAEGIGPVGYEKIYLEAVQTGDGKSTLSVSCGPWIAEGVITEFADAISLDQITCWDDQKRGFSFSGVYERGNKVVKGKLQICQWDLKSFFPHKAFSESIAGSGPVMWNVVYDFKTLNIWTQCCLWDQLYWLNFMTDQPKMDQGTLSLTGVSSSIEGVTAHWEKSGSGWCVRAVEGDLCGIHIALSDGGRQDFLGQLTLNGSVHFDLNRIAHLLPISWKEKICKLGVAGYYVLEGEWICSKNPLILEAFKGTLTGNGCQVGGVDWSDCVAQLEYQPGRLQLSKGIIKDGGAQLSVHELILQGKHMTVDRLVISDLRLAKLKTPWTRWGPRGKPFFRALHIHSLILENCLGDFDDLQTLQGSGKLEFTNIPKRNFLSNLLFLPSEITARIGLDLTALVPAQGTIVYKIGEGKIYLEELKEMYSDGKLSRFYLAKGCPAFIDFQGKLNVKLKMKQYNLLMKLVEFLTITVKGTVLHPTYTFTNSEYDK